MRNRIIAILLALPLLALAQPTYDLTTDVNYPDRDLKPLTFLQGATPHLLVSVQQKGSTYTNISADSMVFSYGVSGTASAFVQVTNTTITASDGTFLIPFTAANLNTNGSFWYTAMLKGAGGGMYYSGSGNLEIVATTVTGSPGAIDLSTPLDWDGYVYSSQDSAPAIGGSGVTSVTNASGQVTFSVAESTSLTITASDGITVTTNADDRAIAVDATVFRADGSVAMTADLPMGGFNIDNAGTGTFTTAVIADLPYVSDGNDSLIFLGGSGSAIVNVFGVGFEACQSNSGFNVNGIGYNACRNNSGFYVNGLGGSAGEDNTNDYVNILGAWSYAWSTDGTLGAEQTWLSGDLYLYDPPSSGGDTTGTKITFNGGESISASGGTITLSTNLAVANVAISDSATIATNLTVKRVYLASGVYVEALGTTNFLFTCGTNSAYIGFE